MYNYDFKFIVILNIIAGYLKWLAKDILVMTWSSAFITGSVTGEVG